jgi:hypothetical protein
MLPQSDPSLCDYIDANETALSIGQVMTGATVTNGVEVQGYPFLIDLKDRGLVDSEDAALTCLIKGHVLCAGDVLHGQPYAQGTTGVSTQLPVILAEPDYTQAMRDAGNRFTQATADFVVVGLWAGNTR